jgi:hypothetical protein
MSMQATREGAGSVPATIRPLADPRVAEPRGVMPRAVVRG